MGCAASPSPRPLRLDEPFFGFDHGPACVAQRGWAGRRPAKGPPLEAFGETSMRRRPLRSASARGSTGDRQLSNPTCPWDALGDREIGRKNWLFAGSDAGDLVPPPKGV